MYKKLNKGNMKRERYMCGINPLLLNLRGGTIKDKVPVKKIYTCKHKVKSLQLI